MHTRSKKVFLILGTFLSISLLSGISNAADRGEQPDPPTFNKEKLQQSKKERRTGHIPLFSSLSTMTKNALWTKKGRVHTEIKRQGSDDSLTSGITTATASTAILQKPEKKATFPLSRTEVVNMYNGGTKTYTFDCCSSILLPEYVTAVALAAAERCLDLCTTKPGQRIERGFTQRVSVPTDDDIQYSYQVGAFTSPQDGHTKEMELLITRHKPTIAAYGTAQENEVFPVRVHMKQTPEGGAMVETISQAACRLRGYDEHITDAIHYHEGSTWSGYQPNILVLPMLKQGLGDLIISLNEQSPQLKERFLGKEDHFLTPDIKQFDDTDLICLAESLAKAIYAIFEEGFDFKRIPEIKHFGLYDKTRVMYQAPSALFVPPHMQSDILSAAWSSAQSSEEQQSTFPRAGIISWLGSVYAMLAGVGPIYQIMVRSQLTFDEPTFGNLLELLKQTSHKDHVIAQLERTTSSWKKLKSAGKNTPKVSVSLPPKVHLLVLISYMLRGNPDNRPSIKQCLEYLQKVKEKHNIAPSSP